MTVDELVLKIRADTKELRSDLKKIKGQLETTGKSGKQAFVPMGASLKNLKVLAGAAAAAIAGIGAVNIGRNIAEVGSNFEDLRDSLNQVFGGIEQGDQALDRILNFAQTTPFQVETVTKAFIALKSAGIEPTEKMLQTFADTASVSTDQLGTFEALIRVVQRSAGGGLGLEELNMITDRGIDVFSGLEEQLGKSRNEIAEFGKTADGARQITDAMINTLGQTFGGAMEAKMDNLSTIASNMNIAFRSLADEVFQSGFGDFLKELAEDMTKMAEAMSRMIRISQGRATVQDLGVQTTREVIDPETGEVTGTEDVSLDEQLKQLEEINKATERNKELLLERARLNTKGSGLQTANELIDIENLIKQEEEHIVKLEEKIKKRDEAAEAARKAKAAADADPTAITTDETSFLAELEKLVKDTIPEVDVLNDKIEMVQSIMTKKDVKGNPFIDEADATRVIDFLTEQRDLAVEAQANKDAFVPSDEMAAEFENIKGHLAATVTEGDKLKATLDAIADIEADQQLLDALGLTPEQIQAVKDEIADLQKTASETSLTLDEELKQAVIENVNAFTTDFVNALMDGESALESFKNFSKQLVSQIISTFLQMAVVNKILNAVFGLTGTDSELATFTFGKRATGGSVNAKQPYLVGERGPEIFVPSGAGSIMNSSRTAAMGGGGGITLVQNNNFALGVEATTRAEVQKMLPQIAETSKMAVFEAAARGGAYRKGLMGR